MSESWWAVMLTAGWLGLLTAISPCPLATNVAAVSFIGRRVGSPVRVLLAGALYTAGRSVAYIVLGALLVFSLVGAPMLSHVLQKYMNIALGPLLIVVGLILLGAIRLPTGSGNRLEALQTRLAALGFWGAFPLGALFALSFCPTSAALFFGSLLPLALERESGFWLPLTYGIATGLPVLGFAVVIAFGAGRLARYFDRVTVFERWARRITGAVFCLVGGYFSWIYFGF